MSEDQCRILPIIDGLPKGFDAILVEARREGHVFVERFHAEWQEGRERYDGENEGLFGAFLGERFVGMAAIGRDPYAQDPSIGRLRHVFVIRAARREGVAAALVEACLERGRGFDLIRLRSRNPGTRRLYERLGFEPVALKDATHVFRKRLDRRRSR